MVVAAVPEKMRKSSLVFTSGQVLFPFEDSPHITHDGVIPPPTNAPRSSAQLGANALQARTEQDVIAGHDAPHARLRELITRARNACALACDIQRTLQNLQPAASLCLAWNHCMLDAYQCNRHDSGCCAE